MYEDAWDLNPAQGAKAMVEYGPLLLQRKLKFTWLDSEQPRILLINDSTDRPNNMDHLPFIFHHRGKTDRKQH